MSQWVTLAEAASLVEDGYTIAPGGMTLYRRPVAFVRELLRRPRRPRDLTLLAFTAGYESDLLVGAKCATRVRSCYFGLEVFGFAPMFTELTQRGQLTVIEETEASLALGIRAGIGGLNFMPSHAWVGTDLPTLRPDVKQVTDPYSGEVMTAFPALSVDIAMIHALEGDETGNIRLNNNTGVDLELVYLAKTVIATVERRVGRVIPSADSTIIAGTGIDFLALAPGGAWPTSCYPLYPLAGREFFHYVEACAAGEFDRYLDEFLLREPPKL